MRKFLISYVKGKHQKPIATVAHYTVTKANFVHLFVIQTLNFNGKYMTIMRSNVVRTICRTEEYSPVEFKAIEYENTSLTKVDVQMLPKNDEMPLSKNITPHQHSSG